MKHRTKVMVSYLMSLVLNLKTWPQLHGITGDMDDNKQLWTLRNRYDRFEEMKSSGCMTLDGVQTGYIAQE